MSVLSRRLAALALAVGLATSGCGTDGSDPEDARTRVVDGSGEVAKTGTGERRTDLAPLTKRFTALGEPASATWLSGTLGDDRVPGPSTYWIDAVVTLPDGQGRVWASRYRTLPTDERPDVVPALADDVPADLTAGDALDTALSTSGFVVDAYLSAADDRVVLVAKGQ